jgi:hypothetical protein
VGWRSLTTEHLEAFLDGLPVGHLSRR